MSLVRMTFLHTTIDFSKIKRPRTVKMTKMKSMLKKLSRTTFSCGTARESRATSASRPTWSSCSVYWHFSPYPKCSSTTISTATIGPLKTVCSSDYLLATWDTLEITAVWGSSIGTIKTKWVKQNQRRLSTFSVKERPGFDKCLTLVLSISTNLVLIKRCKNSTGVIIQAQLT